MIAKLQEEEQLLMCQMPPFFTGTLAPVPFSDAPYHTCSLCHVSTSTQGLGNGAQRAIKHLALDGNMYITCLC